VAHEITAKERELISTRSSGNTPQYGHLRIQGCCNSGTFNLSARVIYGHLRVQGQIEPYERR